MEETPALPLKIGPGETPVLTDASPFNLPLVEASEFIRVTEARDKFRVTGKGLGAAVLDTGINKDHEDFGNRVKATLDFTNDSTKPRDKAVDDNGHGTHVAGIIAANRHHKGIAPEADIFAIKIINKDQGKISWLVNALNWINKNVNSHNISVVSISLSDKNNYKSEDDLESKEDYASFAEAIKNLHEKNIPVVAAAGNEYAIYKSNQGMGFPAIYRHVISVGAVFDSSFGPIEYKDFKAKADSTSAGQITPFSQRLSESKSSKNYTKIFSPGSPITSTSKSNNSGSAIQNGTSQAAPFVTGVVLLLQELYKREKGKLPPVSLLLNCLQSGGLRIVDSKVPDNVKHTEAEFFCLNALSALQWMSRELNIV